MEAKDFFIIEELMSEYALYYGCYSNMQLNHYTLSHAMRLRHFNVQRYTVQLF